MQIKSWYLWSFIGVNIACALHVGLQYWFTLDADLLTAKTDDYLCSLFLVLWIERDSTSYPKIVRPYEFAYLINMICIFYLPYYLWRTRGSLGLFIFVGLLTVYLLPFIIPFTLYFIKLRLANAL